jgi:glycosyltransferase involved in cell wall biosynthesis
MKILVYYNPGLKNDCFEGTRIRKNIKGSLELNSVSWVESLFALPDILHLLSPEDEAKAHDAKEEGLKVVVSCGYAEDDPYARFFSKDNEGKHLIKGKSERILEGADLIFVPSEAIRNALIAAGIKNPHVRVVSPGVNPVRFEKSGKVEQEIFYRYMRLSPTQKYVVSVGNYDESAKIESLEKIASNAPKTKFFFFGVGKYGRVSGSFLKKLNHEAPSNCHFSDVLEDDVYRSAIMSASVYLSNPAVGDDSLVSLEAMAGKTQIIVLGRPLEKSFLIDKTNCYCCDKEEKAAKAIESYCLGNLAPTIIEGYKTAKANSLSLVGSQLKAYYESVLGDSEEEK